mmetsp:Transcript_65832/g.116682  ORF Transcript_65832/g.116682 Transcript_65832/m.116682 type:complete len:305 (-) Transcript_65832:224-1138(-)
MVSPVLALLFPVLLALAGRERCEDASLVQISGNIFAKEHAFGTNLVAKENAFGSNGKIPCKIHQTWKTHTVPSVNEQDASSWKSLNPGCLYKLWDDTEVAAFVQDKSKDLIWPIWERLTPVQRADAFRYLVVLEEGGIYADIDAENVLPVSEWGIPADVTMLVGNEGNFHLSESLRQHVGFARPEQLEQFFFAARPGHPVLRRAAEIIRMKMDWMVENTIELTGPGCFSDAVHEFLANVSDSKVSFVEGQTLSYPADTAMGPEGEKIWIESANKVSFPGFSTDFDSQRLIVHKFKGSWKSATVP